MATVAFEIQDMTCGHCVRAITEAVRELDPSARVEADFAAHRVSVDTNADAERLAAAIREAGYTPLPV